MPVTLHREVNDGAVHPRDLMPGQLAEIVAWPDNGVCGEDRMGHVCQVSSGELFYVGERTMWGRVTGLSAGARVRVLEDGETFTVTNNGRNRNAE